MGWSNEQLDGLAVVTGCDQCHEWMLPWWYKCYIAYDNKFPLYFGDFGMSYQMRGWCAKRGTLLDLTARSNRLSWFKKPLAILATTASKIAWLDLDCEVCGNLSPIFGYPSVAITIDTHYMHNGHSGHRKAIATGVVVSPHGHPLMLRWAEACASSKMRGDQEVFNSIIDSNDDIDIMPPEYQWLRLDGNNEEALIMHWTGAAGKSIIRRAMSSNKPTAAINRPRGRPLGLGRKRAIRHIIRPVSPVMQIASGPRVKKIKQKIKQAVSMVGRARIKQIKRKGR